MDSTNEFNFINLIENIGLQTQDLPSPALYIVGLPIGNLSDISLRALWVLTKVDLVAAEDTRQTKKLLDKFNISVRLDAVHQHNEREGAERIITHLEEGKRVALVTDAGTPAISDPGTKVVREVMEAGFRVIPIPGASAVVTAMSAAGMEPEGFIFHGFLEGGSKEREKILKELLGSERTFVLYEAPHRIKKLTEELGKVLADQPRRIVIARELTKKFETIYALESSEIIKWGQSHNPQGEYVVIVNASTQHRETGISPETIKWVGSLSGKIPPKELAKIAADVTGSSKKELYDFIVSTKKA